MTVFNSMAAGFTTWAMIHPGVTQDLTVTPALNYFSYAFGGPGFSMPMGAADGGSMRLCRVSEAVAKVAHCIRTFPRGCR